jgi:hypothetical protein
MKQLTSIVVVFLSVVVISLAIFQPPRVETSPVQKQLESTMAMRKWQAETAMLYRDRASRVGTAAELATQGVEQKTIAANASISEVKVADSQASTVFGASVLPTSSQMLLSTSQTQWEAIASIALADAERWNRVRREFAPQLSQRRRSTWAWTVAMGAGGFAIAGLFVSSWIAPEKTIESTKKARDRNAGPAFDDWQRIQISIPHHWIEIRQSAGVTLRRWLGYVLVVTALIACWIF